MTSFYSPLLMIKVDKTLDGNIENQHLYELECVYSLGFNKYVVTCFCENNKFLMWSKGLSY